MTCTETKHLLNSYVDGELDSAGSLSVEDHFQRCTSCLTDMENLRGLSSAIQNGGLRFTAPLSLKKNVQAAIRTANPEVRRSFFDWRWASALAAAVLVIVVGFALSTRWKSSSDEALLVDDIISSHVRSMMANHITDVASSDSHTVKPWFSGKLDYSPPAKDLTAQGFRLVGGRMDYLDNPSGCGSGLSAQPALHQSVCLAVQQQCDRKRRRTRASGIQPHPLEPVGDDLLARIGVESAGIEEITRGC